MVKLSPTLVQKPPALPDLLQRLYRPDIQRLFLLPRLGPKIFPTASSLLSKLSSNPLTASNCTASFLFLPGQSQVTNAPPWSFFMAVRFARCFSPGTTCTTTRIPTP